MKIILHLATSKDGFIAKLDGDSDWVSPVDGEIFEKRVREAGCVVVGKTTFAQYAGQLYPVSGALNLVLTSDKSLTSEDPNVRFVLSPEEAIETAESSGHEQLIVAGGAKTGEAFLKAGLVSEIFFSVHPLNLVKGIKAPIISRTHKYKLVDTKDLADGTIEQHYAML